MKFITDRAVQTRLIIWLLCGSIQTGWADGSFRTLVDFDQLPQNPTLLIQGAENRFYGLTGGNAGSVFSLDGTGSSLRFLHQFDRTNGWSPTALVQGSDGLLYGCAAYGGIQSDPEYPDGNGVVFRIDPDEGQYTVLYEFTGTNGDGVNPGSLIQGANGVLYGTTWYGGAPGGAGGAGGNGSVFRLNTDGSGYQILHRFQGVNGDGSVPIFIIQNPLDGALDGLTQAGGVINGGTLFKLGTYGTGYEILHDFAGQVVALAPSRSGHILGNVNDGLTPSALVAGTDGTIYGTTYFGGSHFGNSAPGAGVLYSVKPDGTGYQLWHSFNEFYFSSDGFEPNCLTMGSDGFLYGTTQYGNALAGPDDLGSIFKMNLKVDPFDGFQVLKYMDILDGASPLNSLALTTNGTLWGIAASGGGPVIGPDGKGTIFQLGNQGTGFQKIYNFDVKYPSGQLLQADSGVLYGATLDTGTVYSYDPNNGIFAVLNVFSGSVTNTNGCQPNALIRASSGGLFGTTAYGGAGAGNGTVFTLGENGTGFDVLYRFTGDGFNGDGALPSTIALGGDGFLYGTTTEGGASAGGVGHGTLFKLATNGVGYTVLHRFTASDGEHPSPGVLVYGSDGAIYGSVTILNIPEATGGAIYKIATDGSSYQILHLFSPTSGDGSRPVSLFESSDGFLYGATFQGGDLTSYDEFGDQTTGGTIFRIARDGSGYAVLYRFGLPGSGVINPTALIQGSDRWLYGMAATIGGTNALFKLTRNGADFGVFPAPLGNGGVTSLFSGNGGAVLGTESDPIAKITGRLFQFAPETPGNPSFFANPQSVIDASGSRERLWAGTIGGTNITYQWRLNGASIPGQVAATLILSNLNAALVGWYDLVASNGSYSVTSGAAPVSILGITANDGTSPSVTIDGAVGSHFALEFTTNLLDSPWVPLTSFMVSTPHTVVPDPDSAVSSSRFYRAYLISP